VFSKTRPHAGHPWPASATRTRHSENSARIRARDKGTATRTIRAAEHAAAAQSAAHRIAGSNDPDCASSNATRGIRAGDGQLGRPTPPHRIAPYNHPDCDL